MPTEIVVPRHVGIIMDGNRRWARKNFISRLLGHKGGVETAERIARHVFARGVQFLTLYAFSTENWSREQEEIDDLMDIFRNGFDENITRLARENISIHFIGEHTRFPQDIQQKMAQITVESQGHDKTLIIAIGYGGRDEIVRMVRRAASSGVDLQTIDEQIFCTYRDAHFAPDIDLVIRTGGMPRDSGFCLWQAAYANKYFTDTLWPAFTAEEFDKILEWNIRQTQNFGR